MSTSNTPSLSPNPPPPQAAPPPSTTTVAAAATKPQPQPPPQLRQPPQPQPPTMIDFDLQGYIDDKLASGNKDIIIPSPPINHQTGLPLKYRVKPNNKHHLLLKGLNGITISTTAANGPVEFICTETTRAITLLNCTDVTIKGLIIDYDPLPYTQGIIVGFGNNKPWLKLTHEIELCKGYISNRYVDNYKYEIYQPNGNLLYGSYFGTEIKKDARSPSRLTVTIPERYSTNPEYKDIQNSLQIGDVIVIGCTYAPNGKLPHAICCMGCNNLKFEDITMYASNNFGFFEKNCYSTSYVRCIIDRRRLSLPSNITYSNTGTLVPRMRSLNADAFHSSNARKGPNIIDCVAKYMGDDGVNIHGDYHMITKVINVERTSASSTSESMDTFVVELRVLSRNNDGTKINIDINDPVEIMAYNGESSLNKMNNPVVVTSVCLDDECPQITDEEKDFLLKQNLSNDLKTNKGGSLTTAYKIAIQFDNNNNNNNNNKKYNCDQFKSLIQLLCCIGSVITSKNKMGNNFNITGNEFGYTRSRGIIVKSSNGIVSNNTLVHCIGEGIRVGPGYWFLESGGNSNIITIQNNYISNCSSYGIAIYSFGSNNITLASSNAHKEINIIHNTLLNCPIPNIVVTSTTNYIIEDNQCRNIKKNIIANGPPNMKNILKDYKKIDTIMIINCSK